MKNISIIFESSQLNISLAMKGYLQKGLMIRKEKFGREFENESLLKRTLILKEKEIYLPMASVMSTAFWRHLNNVI